MPDQTETTTDHDRSSGEDQALATATPPSGDHTTARKTLSLPAMLGLVLGALLVGILIALALRAKPDNNAPTGDSSLATAHADLEARRNELNRQRAALGLPPLDASSGSESVDDVAARIKKDIATLTDASAKFQQLLAESDAEAAQKSRELADSEKIRQELLHENSRLMEERDKAHATSGPTEQLRTQLEQANKELATLRERLASTENRPTEASLESTKRQLEEANRARAFFENRAKVLEAKLADANQASPPIPQPAPQPSSEPPPTPAPAGNAGQ